MVFNQFIYDNLLNVCLNQWELALVFYFLLSMGNDIEMVVVEGETLNICIWSGFPENRSRQMGICERKLQARTEGAPGANSAAENCKQREGWGD